MSGIYTKTSGIVERTNSVSRIGKLSSRHELILFACQKTPTKYVSLLARCEDLPFPR